MNTIARRLQVKMFSYTLNREVKISLRQRVRQRQCNIAVVFVTFLYKKRDERLIASISSSTTTITNRNPGITQEMMISAHKHFVLVLVVVVVVKS